MLRLSLWSSISERAIASRCPKTADISEIQPIPQISPIVCVQPAKTGQNPFSLEQNPGVH